MIAIHEIAHYIGAEVEGDPSLTVERLRPIESARAGDLTFMVKDRTPPEGGVHATAVIVHPEESREHFPESATLLRTADPYLGFQRAVELFHPVPPPPFEGVDASAAIDPTAEIAADVRIGPGGVTVCAGAKIGAGSVLYPGVFVGPRCEIGAGTTLHPRVTLYAETVLGERCIVHAGAVVGSDGFGFVPTEKGAQKIHHAGRVVVEDDVEIGANATIDRGALDDTVIGRGTKIDNLVHVGHNSVIGPHCFLAGQAGLAGSCTLGTGVQIAGQVGLAGHLSIGDGAQVGAKSGVRSDVPAGAKYFGYPATDFRNAARSYSLLQRLPEYQKKLLDLSQRLEEFLDGHR